MALARREVFTRLVHGVLVLGLMFLALEVHLLRVAVEDVGLGYGGDDRVERLIASLDQPLRTIGRRLGEVSEALDRPALASGAPAVPAVAGEGMTHVLARAQDAPAAPAANVERRLVASQLESQLGSLIAAVQKIDKCPKVTGRSLPVPSSSARGTDRQAINKTLASLRSSPLEKSRFLTMTPKELLARYGKPTSISIEEGGTVYWSYDLTAMDAGSCLYFRLYDGRVIGVGY